MSDNRFSERETRANETAVEGSSVETESIFIEADDTPILPGHSRSDPEFAQNTGRELPSANSSNSSICRICQLGAEDSGEVLRDTSCDCKGSVKRVHASCLIVWVRQKGSNTCEICGKTFFVSPPNSQQDLVPIISVQNWPSNASDENSRIERCLANRCVFVALVFLLLIVTGSAAAFTVKSFRVLQEDHGNVAGDPHLQFLLCLCFLLISGTATLVFLGSWLYLETATHCRMMRRRRILQSLGITI